jgi:hypothetical protein
MRTLHTRRPLDVAPGELGVTIRRGSKWSGATPGEDIELCSCVEVASLGSLDTEFYHDVVGYATIQHVRRTMLRHLFAWEVAKQHVAEARTWDGLLEGLARAYGESLSDYETITVVRYVRTV